MDRNPLAPGDGISATASPSRALFAAAIALAALLSLLHALRIVSTLSWADAAPALLATLAGVLLADFASGLVHWACDTWGNERSRWFGASLIRSFREHHRSPTAMLAHDWIEVNGEAAGVAAIVLLGMLADPPAAWLQQHPAVHCLVFATATVGALSNQLHQWAHAPCPPRLVRMLQRSGLVLSMRRHAPHHRLPCVQHYCISTGWLNPTLDLLRFWRGLEHAIEWSTGKRPRLDDSQSG